MPAPAYLPLNDYVRAEIQAEIQAETEALHPPPPTADADPRALIEQRLRSFWQEIFRRQDIAPDDDFFHLGGHSLKAAQLSARTQAAFGVALEARQLFETPTIRELADYIHAAQQQRKMPDAPALPRKRAAHPLPLSFAEERMLFLALLEPDQPVYNINFYFRTEGLDQSLLEPCLNYVIARHEPLRTTYNVIEGQAVRCIHPHTPVKLPIVDLTELPEAAREAEAQRLMALEAARPFDLRQGPLFRAAIYKMTETRHIHFICMHHIITDGWSTGILARELLLAYLAFSQGKTPPLPPLPFHYADYADWQRQQMTSSALQDQLAYWRKQLAGQLPALELPTDRPRPAKQTYNGAVLEFAWPEPLTQRLRRFNQGQNVTLFMTLLTGLSVLCFRYAAQTDILIGTPIANRRHAETEALLGLFINTLVMRIDLSGGPTFREALRRAAQTALDAYAHQDVPFDRLVQELDVTRDTNRPPVFSVMLALQNVPMPLQAVPGLAQTIGVVSSGSAKFDLFISIGEVSGKLIGSVEYNTDLFDRETIERMIGHYRTLLEQAALDVDRPIAEMPMLDDAERHRLLVEWNATQKTYSDMACIHTLFAAQAARTPNAVALRCEGRALTFGEVEQRANQVAHALIECGIAPGAVVGVCLEPAPLLVIALLGIMKAGAAYLPLDPGHPPERLRHLAADARLHFILTQTAHAPTMKTLAGTIMALDAPQEQRLIARQPTAAPAAAVGLDDLAYVLYTSGSTGAPKGVMGPHRGMVNRFFWMWDTYPFAPGEVCCQKTTLGFVDSIWEIFGPLLRGVPLVIAPRQVAQTADALVDLLARERVTRLVLVPSLLRALLAQFPNLGARLPHLKYITVSGEAMPAELVARLFAAAPQVRLLNLYGSTEVAADVTYHEIRPGDLPLIGRPIANTQLYVLAHTPADGCHAAPQAKTTCPTPRTAGSVQPIGVPGELYVGGACLAAGYLNHPELTAEKFVESPFKPGEKLYRTGDLVRYRADGALEILGRADAQVKVRGMRVAPEEVEFTLRQHPVVAQAAVVDQADEHGYTALAAFIVPAASPGHAPPEPETLRALLQAFLQERLPAHMIPTRYGVLPALPLTPSGKIDRRTLRAMPAPPERSRTTAHTTAHAAVHATAAQDSPDAPDPIERRLIALWERTLNRPVCRTDNFFDLGGHSLLAVHLFKSIESEFGRPIPLAAMFQAQTVEKMAALLRCNACDARAARDTHDTPPKPPALPTLPKLIVPMQPQGEGSPLFLFHNLAGGLTGYAKLVEHLGTARPIYGVQPVGLDGTAQPLVRIEAMAAAYVEAIRQVQPQGPYLLCGASFGGVLAYEAAQQLQAQGQRVGLLAVLDTRIDYNQPFTLAWRIANRAGTLLYHAHKLFTLPLSRKVTYLRQRIKKLRQRFRSSAWQRQYAAHITLGQQLPNTLLNVYEMTLLAQARYRPRPYAGRVVLLAAQEHVPFVKPLMLRAWKRLAQGGLEVIHVPGDHSSMVREPFVREVAARLRDCQRTL